MSKILWTKSVIFYNLFTSLRYWLLVKPPAGQIGNSQSCKDILNCKHSLKVFLLKDLLCRRSSNRQLSKSVLGHSSPSAYWSGVKALKSIRNHSKPEKNFLSLENIGKKRYILKQEAKKIFLNLLLLHTHTHKFQLSDLVSLKASLREGFWCEQLKLHVLHITYTKLKKKA